MEDEIDELLVGKMLAVGGNNSVPVEHRCKQ